MSDAPSAWASTARPSLRVVAWGGLVGLGVAAAGQTIGLLLFVAHGANGGYAPYARLGEAYVELFHDVPVALVLVAGAGRPLSASVGIALLLVTAASVVALSLVGRRLAVAEDRTIATLLVVVGAAAAYSVVPALLAVVARGEVALPGELDIGGSVLSVDVSVVAAFATPFAIAVAAVAFGALTARVGRETDRTVADAIAGALRAFALSLALSVVAVLVLASVEPAFARAYGSVIAAPDNAKGRALIAAHALLLLPNQAIWILVPAMGACDEVVLDGDATPFLCYDRRPTELPLLPGSDGVVATRARFQRPPAGYLAFLLVPLVATVAGGRRAAGGVGSTRDRVLAGAASGAVFAVVTAVAIALARVDVAVGGGFLGRSTFRLAAGPELVRGTILALAWGVAGGALGGFTARRRPRAADDTDGDATGYVEGRTGTIVE